MCAASIATGVGPDQHDIPSMNWYHRGEGRYVEYGTSFKASQTFGFKRSLTDTIYNMNLEHLSKDVKTVFESLDDEDIRTAGTTYLMYRGRHRHEVTNDTALTRLASTVFRHAVYGPREFFYADIFASRKTGCRAQLGLPGQRDQHAGCVGAQLVEDDLFDFLLLSLPDNDTHSHKNGPFAQVSSIAAADKQIERLMHAAGGPEAFLEDYAMIVCSDHSQSQVEREIDVFKAFDGFGLEPPMPTRVRRDGEPPEIAVCPSSRSAQVYVLDRERRTELIPRIERTALALEGVDLVMHLTDHPDGEAAIRGERGELRFMHGGELSDRRGERWSVEGDLVAARADGQGRRAVLGHLPGRARARVVGAALPDGGGGAAVGQARLRVRRLGRRPPRRRRLPRLLARQRLARHAAVVRHGAGQRGREAAVVAARHRADGARALRRRRREGRAPRPPHPGGPGARRRRPAADLARPLRRAARRLAQRAQRRHARRRGSGPRSGAPARATS